MSVLECTYDIRVSKDCVNGGPQDFPMSSFCSGLFGLLSISLSVLFASDLTSDASFAFGNLATLIHLGLPRYVLLTVISFLLVLLIFINTTP